MLPTGSSHSSPQFSANLNASERERLLTAEQVAQRWQISTAAIYRLARERSIPSVRLGRYYRFRAESIEAWEDAQEAMADG